MPYGTTLTILEPGYAVGYETFDVLIGHGRSWDEQIAAYPADKQMTVIDEHLASLNGESVAGAGPVARYKQGYTGKGEVLGRDGKFHKMPPQHLASQSMVKTVAWPKGTGEFKKKPRLKNKPQTIA